MYILSIDSTTKQLSVIISSDGSVISKIIRGSARNSMEMIISDIDDALKKASMSIKEIDAFGVNLGPGDFTGTRIGISIIKTLGWVLNKPVYGIDSLDVFASAVADSSRDLIGNNVDSSIRTIIAPCLDVRKGEIFYCLYDITIASRDDNNIANMIIGSKSYKISRMSSNYLVKADAFNDDLLKNVKKAGGGSDTKIIFGGNAIESYGEIFSALTSDSQRFLLDRKSAFPVPEFLDLCVNHRIKDGIISEKINPIYVREFLPFNK